MEKRPLEGVKVVELATVVAGPCCCRYFADLGADVVKVEPPGGDPVRYFAPNEGRPFGDAEDTTYTLENAGVKCITLNIKTPEGTEALDRLIAGADILITNWRQLALERAKLDYETLKVKYPKLVFGQVSGYGEKGVDKDLPGYDFTAFFARGGVIGTLYDVDSMPMNLVAGFGDHQVGLYLASGVLAALYRARSSGKGDKVVVSLFHAAMWDIGVMLQAAQYGDVSTQFPISRRHLANPLQVAHKTKDGRWLQIAIPRYDASYQKFMTVINRPDLIGDERFFPQKNLQSHLDEFYDIMVAEIKKRTLDEWCEILTKADLPYARCQTWTELLQDQQAWESGALAKVDFPSGKQRTLVRPPVIFTETEPPPYERGAFLGEHTEEVLAGLGYSKAQIDAMIAAGQAEGLKRIG